MSFTPVCAAPGNSNYRQVPAITLTAVHRESLAKPAHTTILQQASRTMFSTKPAQRPAGPRRWFRKRDPPKTPAQAGPIIQQTPVMMGLSWTALGNPPQQPQMVKLPRVFGHQPVVQTPQPHTPQIAPPNSTTAGKCMPHSSPIQRLIRKQFLLLNAAQQSHSLRQKQVSLCLNCLICFSN